MLKYFWKTGILALILGGSTALAETPKVKFAFSSSASFPYQIGESAELANPPGIAVEIVQSAAQQLGIEAQIVRLPNKRVLESVKAGEVDGVFQFSFKEDRLANGAYPMKEGKLDGSRRISTLTYYVYVKKESPVQWDGKQFSHLKKSIGGNIGYSIVDDLKKMGIAVEEAKTTEQNFQKLQMDRIDGFAAQDVITEPFLSSGKYPGIDKLPTPLSTKDYFLMLGHQFIKEHGTLAEALWNKIGEIRDTKTQEILHKYKE